MEIRPFVLHTLLIALGLLGAAAAHAGAPVIRPAGNQRPLRLFYGGIFHTGSLDLRDVAEGVEATAAERLTVEAVLVRDTRIVALGDYGEISRSSAAEGAERIDFGGAHVYPGFQDAHGYVERLGATLEDVDLANAQSFAEVIERVREFASTVPAGEWVLGTGWDESLWEVPAYPTHEALSEAVPDHPVLIRRVDGLMAIANLAAMGKAGLDPAEPNAAGSATGLFSGERLQRIASFVPAPSRKTRRRRILRALDELVPLGLTAVHAMDVDEATLGIFTELRDRGELKLRLLCYLDSLETARSLGSERIAAIKDRYAAVSVAGVAWEVDGGLGSRGAALLQPYADASEARGTARFSPQELGNSIETCARLGLQPAIRATGDGAVRIAVQAIRQATLRAEGFELTAPRIEYLQLVTEQDLVALGDLWVQPTMMPQHLATDLRWIPQRLGAARAARAYGWRSIRERAARPLAFGSAFPIGAAAPLLGLHAAITRQDPSGKPAGGFHPSERLSALAAVAGYTSGAAAAVREGEERGRIALGYAADFTAFSEDLFRWNVENATEALRRTAVVATIVNGDVVFSTRK